MAAPAGNEQRQLRVYVPVCRVLLVAVVLLMIGDAVGAIRARLPPQALHQTEQMQAMPASVGSRTLLDEAPGADGLPALNNNNEQQTAGAGGRRMLVGSRAPTCTYNECRGCRHRCSVQEVPIDASDPINSAYHYKCICHL